MTRSRIWKVALAAAALVAIVLVGAYYGAPYWTVHELKQAARDRDADALLAHVDQAALRKSMQLALGFSLAQPQGSPASQPAARPMLDAMPELLSAPTSLMAMLLQGHPSRVLDPDAVFMPILPEAAEGDWTVELRHVGRSTVEVRAKGSTGGAFILRRAGLFRWKWSAIGSAS